MIWMQRHCARSRAHSRQATGCLAGSYGRGRDSGVSQFGRYSKGKAGGIATGPSRRGPVARNVVPLFCSIDQVLLVIRANSHSESDSSPGVNIPDASPLRHLNSRLIWGISSACGHCQFQCSPTIVKWFCALNARALCDDRRFLNREYIAINIFPIGKNWR